jgi:hypothetical protein
MTSLSRACFVALCALAALGVGVLPSCTDQCEVTKTGNPSSMCGAPASGAVSELAKQCGIDIECEGGGIAQGNTAISGVQSIDSYFASVLRFQVEADRLSASLNAEITAIRAAFGIDPAVNLETELRRRIDASVEGELLVHAGVPSCTADASAVLAAGARCEGEADTSAVAMCVGRCELALGRELKCDAEAELACTFLASASACQGECKGRCSSDASAGRDCAGICRGSCDGACSLYSDATATQCGGRCDGMCTGSCELELPEGGPCDGACSGECTAASADGRCDGASAASCRGGPNALLTCAGRCEGAIETMQTKAECSAVANAEAKLSLQCAPARVVIDYRLRSDLDPTESARFDVGMRILRERLPTLLAMRERAEQAVSAGDDLAAGASTRLKAAAQSVRGDANLQLQFGVICALREASRVPEVVTPSAQRLVTAMRDSLAVTRALGPP